MMGCLSLLAALFFGTLLGFSGLSTSVSPPETGVTSDFQRYASIPQSRTDDGAFVLGYEDAPLTIVVFEDFFCPHCQALHPTIEALVDAYVRSGAVKYEWRALATAGGERMDEVARLLECAEEQRTGAFWEGYLLTYARTMQNEFPNDAAQFYAQQLELDEESLRECAEDAIQVLVDGMLANELGVMGTPDIFLRYSSGEVIHYEGGRSFEDFARVIEAGKHGKPNTETEA
jgi:protein-disulfide isomerase